MKYIIIISILFIPSCEQINKEIRKPTHAEINDMLLDELVEHDTCLNGKLRSISNQDTLFNYWTKRYEASNRRMDSLNKLW